MFKPAPIELAHLSLGFPVIGSRSGGVGRFHLPCWIPSRRVARILAAAAGPFEGGLKSPFSIRLRMACRDLTTIPALASAENDFSGFRRRVVVWRMAPL
jgi:hypothetical protein